jgi:lysosomal acid lipase/cholesteryl ester hydrolase
LFLFFGRKSILSSAVMWQSILYPPIFAKLIDTALIWLFNWRGANISSSQKIAAYAHLYSFTSVKSIVHWFQIMRNAAFQMYDDDFSSSIIRTTISSYRPARFPTKNIVTPIVLLYGDKDSLVHIETMLNQLPEHTIAKPLRSYEHLDILWGENVHEDVIPVVLHTLEEFCPEGDDILLNGSKTTDMKY